MPEPRVPPISVPARRYLELIERRGAIGTWTWQAASGRMTWSGSLHRLMQTDPKTYEPTLEKVLAATHPDDHWLVREQLRPGKTGVNAPVRISLPDGRVRWHSCYSEPIDDSGSLLIGIVQDITDSWTAQSMMRQRAKLTDTVLRLVGGMLWRADPQGSMTFDSGWSEFTGTTLADNVGDGWLERIHPDDRWSAGQVWHQASITKSLYSTAYRLKRFDDVYCRVESKAAPHLDERGNVIEWIGYCAPAIHTEALRTDSGSEDGDRPSGQELKAARALLGMSVDQLAKSSGVSAATIARHEAGGTQVRIRPRKLEVLRERLVSLGIVFGQTGSRRTLTYL